MEQEVISTRNKNIDSAINELCGKLRKSADSYQAVIFLAAIDYDFPLLSQKMKEKFPTAEVIGTSTAGEFSASGFTEGSLILTTMSDSSTKVKGVFIDKASKYPIAYKNDIESAMQYLKAYFASIPYLEHGHHELGNLTTFEAFYETIMYVVFSMMSKYVYTQVKSANGRSDIVMFVGDTAYVFELKINGTAREALDQINSNGYMVPYEAGNRKVVKVGVAFSKDEKNITEWIVE